MPSTMSPLRYPGGKTQLSDFVKNIISLNKIHNPVYCEPFAGGAGIAMSLLLKGYVESVLLNDIDTSVYSVWFAILHDTDKLIRKIMSTPINMEVWQKQRHIYTKHHNDADYSFSLAFATFFLNRTNRSGIITGGPIGGYEQKSKYNLDCRFNKEGLIKKIKAIAERNNNIKLYHFDAIQLINNVLMEQPRENLFVYFDPPYYKQGKNLYMNFFDKKKHDALSLAIKQMDEYFWIVTYDDTEEIRVLYDDRIIRKYMIRYSTNKVRKETELFFASHATKVKPCSGISFK